MCVCCVDWSKCRCDMTLWWALCSLVPHLSMFSWWISVCVYACVSTGPPLVRHRHRHTSYPVESRFDNTDAYIFSVSECVCGWVVAMRACIYPPGVSGIVHKQALAEGHCTPPRTFNLGGP